MLAPSFITPALEETSLISGAATTNLSNLEAVARESNNTGIGTFNSETLSPFRYATYPSSILTASCAETILLSVALKLKGNLKYPLALTPFISADMLVLIKGSSVPPLDSNPTG